MKAFIILWIIYAIMLVMALAGLTYIAVHFLGKIW